MLEFILFAFLVNIHSDIPRQHIGWYTESRVGQCIAAVEWQNRQFPHVKGKVHHEYALCRCYRCGEEWP